MIKIDLNPSFDIRYSTGLLQMLLNNLSYPNSLFRLNRPLRRPAAAQNADTLTPDIDTSISPCIHEIKCHFRDVPHAVSECIFRRPRRRARTRPSSPISPDFEDEHEYESLACIYALPPQPYTKLHSFFFD